MVSIILVVVGVMLILAGLGLRSLVHAFGYFLASAGLLFVLDGGLGFFFEWSDYKKVIIAGVILILFSVVTIVWKIAGKFRSLKK